MEKMSTKEFLKKKNAIVKRVTNLVLIPEDQIVDTPRVMLTTNDHIRNLHSDMCPYCITYHDANEEDMTCANCPMSEAGNKCGDDDDDTWTAANDKWVEQATSIDRMEMYQLTDQYNA